MMTRIATLFIFSLFSLSAINQDENIVTKGQEVPEFTFAAENGQNQKMSDYKGKVVLINFFATWCGPCRAEMPMLQKKVWEKHKDNENFKFLSFGRGHSLEEITKFKETGKYKFPMYPDEDKSIYNKFANKYIPRNYIADKNGTIVYMSKGFSEEEMDKMIDLLDSLLK